MLKSDIIAAIDSRVKRSKEENYSNGLSALQMTLIDVRANMMTPNTGMSGRLTVKKMLEISKTTFLGKE